MDLLLRLLIKLIILWLFLINKLYIRNILELKIIIKMLWRLINMYNLGLILIIVIIHKNQQINGWLHKLLYVKLQLSLTLVLI